MKQPILFLFLGFCLFASCSDSNSNTVTDSKISVENNSNYQKELQEKLILAKDGDIINIPEGTFTFSKSLALDGIPNITIKGAGIDKTILSFKGQEEGAEGLKITADNVTISDLTIADAAGDAIKVQKSDGVTFKKVKVTWSDGPKSSNGAYGFYPVQCKNVLIENCIAEHASDAGIYVGQSEYIVVRYCKAYKNVAGIEIENSSFADVYENEAYNNTGGVLVFDLPELNKKNGHSTRVYNNKIYDNNHENFAPEGNIVGTVPPGSGIVLLASKNTEVYNNQIFNHKTYGCSIVSYQATELSYEDDEFIPFVSDIHIHDNIFETEDATPDVTKRFGQIAHAFGGKPIDIVWGGIPTGKEKVICLQNNKSKNGDLKFIVADLPRIMTPDHKPDSDISKYTCVFPIIEQKKLPL